jgi:serine/threonine protein kinase
VNGQRWKQVRDLFDAALEQPFHLRDQFLAAQTPGDPRLAAEVRELLASYRESDHMLTEPAVKGLEALLPGGEAKTVVNPGEAPTSIIRPVGAGTETTGLVGRRMGQYRLIKKIGSGGMGSVFVAARDDRQFEQRVAIKVVRPSLKTSQILQRFLQERRVLAGLEHPNIARLLDGGTSDEGLPYLVMEYVEGVPIDHYCDERKLSVTERLRLFRIVCDAVHYAHRSLVIHRDLKPVNILVTAEGVPKLLDFGVAKLVGPQAGADMSLTVDTAPMTPEYASPEQVQGDPVTTATDVYALGVMLYRLLTGKSPYRVGKPNAPALFSAITSQEPVKPSQNVLSDDETSQALAEAAVREGTPDKLSRRLKGDLDVIILTALKKEPARRYASVAALSDDIGAHMGGFPVSAQPDSVTYRASKFVRRHTTGVAMAGGVAFALLGGTITSLYYASAASRDKVAAEKRYQDVRELARFVLLDFDDALRQGETSARRALAPKALDYLNKVAAGATSDPALQLEIAEGYLKVGEMHDGDTRGARASFEQALRTAEALTRANRSSEGASVLTARANAALGELFVQSGDGKAALPYYERALSLLEPFGGTAVRQADILRQSGAAHSQLGNYSAALANYTRAYDLGVKSISASPTNPGARRAMAKALEGLGEVYTRTGRIDEALPKLSDAIAIFERVMDDNPALPQARVELAAASLTLGDTLNAAKRYPEAVAAFRRALALTEELGRTQDLPVVLARLAEALLQTGARSEAHDVTKRALDLLFQRVDKRDPQFSDLQQYLKLVVTTPFEDLRSPARALPYAQQLVAMTNGMQPASLDLLARAYFGAGDFARAVETEKRALGLLPEGQGAPALRKELEQNLERFSAGK